MADTGNHRVQIFSHNGESLGTWGTRGTGAGRFRSPIGIAAEGSGNVYAADYGNDRVQVFNVRVSAP